MQRKVGTIMDEALFRKVKQRALIQHTTLNHIFEEALSEYLSRQTSSERKLSTVEMSFGVMRLPKKVVREIAHEDIYAVE